MSAQSLSTAPQYSRVVVEPSVTSIYVGSVSLKVATFVRSEHVYGSTYEAKVSPYAFYNERGKIEIAYTEDDLRRLERGETVYFKGTAWNNAGQKRRVEGRMQPADAYTGRIKVRIFVHGVELIFNTTYRFSGG